MNASAEWREREQPARRGVKPNGVPRGGERTDTCVGVPEAELEAFGGAVQPFFEHRGSRFGICWPCSKNYFKGPAALSSALLRLRTGTQRDGCRVSHLTPGSPVHRV